LKIHFFEEYPTEENLKKIKYINFESRIYLAAKNILEFNHYKKYLNKSNITFGYWPILEKSYWVSPFSYKYELVKLINELESRINLSEQLPILFDLELPIINKKLFFINIMHFSKNKNRIKSIFSNQNNLHINIISAEYPISSKFVKNLYEFIGISYPLEKYNHKKIMMFYSSMLKEKKIKKIKNYIINIPKVYINKYHIGLGTIASGIFGNEPILAPESLDEDLKFLNINKMKETIIYRLGGLNKEYIRVIEKYI